MSRLILFLFPSLSCLESVSVFYYLRPVCLCIWYVYVSLVYFHYMFSCCSQSRSWAGVGFLLYYVLHVDFHIYRCWFYLSILPFACYYIPCDYPTWFQLTCVDVIIIFLSLYHYCLVGEPFTVSLCPVLFLPPSISPDSFLVRESWLYFTILLECVCHVSVK